MFNLFEDSKKSRQFSLDRSKLYEEDRQGLESYRERILTDESAFKISQGQHGTIMKFVDERKSNLQTSMVYLYENLSKNLKEHEKLGLLIEDLKSLHKDIENCIDDLLSYPIPNEEKYMENLVGKLKVVHDVGQEYTMYCKNFRNYKELRTNIINILLQNDPVLPNARLYPLRYQLTKEENSFVTERDMEISRIFIPRDEPRSNAMTPASNKTAVEFDFDIKFSREESRYVSNYYCEGLTLQDQVNRQKVLTTGLVGGPPHEEAFLLFFKLTDDQERLDGDLANLQQRYEIIYAGLTEYKRSKETGRPSYSSQIDTFKDAKTSLQKEGESLKKAYNEIANETKKLKQQLNENNINGPEQQEYQAKLFELQEKTQNSLRQVVELQHKTTHQINIEDDNNVSLYYSECNDKSNDTNEHSVGDEERSHYLAQSVQRNANDLNRTVQIDTSNLNLPDFPGEESHKQDIKTDRSHHHQVISNPPQNIAILRLNTLENESQVEFEAVSAFGLSSKANRNQKSTFHHGFDVSAFEETRLQDFLK